MPYFLSGLVFCLIISLKAAEPPLPVAERVELLARLGAQRSALDLAVIKAPSDPALYSRRGDCLLFLGRFPEAVADFEKMIALDPALDAPHWRLGIAYYFNGQFSKSARQFEKYHDYDGRDRENGVWKFLGDVKVSGVTQARSAMLSYTRFDREPFPALYELLAGKGATEDFLRELKARRGGDQPAAVFFAHYYAGLHEEILGHHEKALALMRVAVASAWGRTAEGGPAYMWQVSRVHYDGLAAAKP
ncbi:MAG: Lipoprotein NlpI precursor [Verrucomicrobiota bacterium]|jgi:tetratricopeptide (TPR) repeat protein